MVFRYLNTQAVSNEFVRTNNRFRNALNALDNSTVGQANRPNLPVANANGAAGTWVQAWDYWLSGFLHYKTVKLQTWMHNAVIALEVAKARDANAANDPILRAQIARETAQGGLWTSEAVEFGVAYAQIMSVNWPM